MATPQSTIAEIRYGTVMQNYRNDHASMEAMAALAHQHIPALIQEAKDYRERYEKLCFFVIAHMRHEGKSAIEVPDEKLAPMMRTMKAVRPVREEDLPNATEPLRPQVVLKIEKCGDAHRLSLGG